MLKKFLHKLILRGHAKLLKGLPEGQRNDIEHSTNSCTIPVDVAFKEGSVSTPSRLVFNAGSKTKTGYSLNNILAKGAVDMIKMVNMVLWWRIGKSVIAGNI